MLFFVTKNVLMFAQDGIWRRIRRIVVRKINLR